MSSQQVGELYYKVGVKGLQEALRDLDKLYEKSGKGPSSSSPFNVAPLDPQKTTKFIKSVDEARKHLQDLANGIGIDLGKVVRQVGKMPDLMIAEAKSRGINNPGAAYNRSQGLVSVLPHQTTVQNLKHELMHAIERMVPKDVFSSIVSGFSPIRMAEISHQNSGFIKDRMQPNEVFASFMERQSPDVIRALIGSDMTTKVAALAGDAAARAVVRATIVNRTAPVTLAGGFGEGVSVDSRYGRGSRVVSTTTTLPASSMSRQGRPDPNDFGATVNAPSSGDDFGAGVLTPAQKAKATAAANAANARASQVQANIAAFMGSNHGGFAGGGGFGGGGGSGGGPTGPIPIPNPQFNNPSLNPWLVNIDRTRRRVGHQALSADAGRASELAGEIGGQVFNYDMNRQLRAARTNVIQEHLRPGHTGSDLTTRQNELVDLQEKAVHLASRRAEIEQRVNSYLGTQVDYSHKIAAEEKAALNFARQRMGRDLTQSEERGIREDTRNQSMRTMLGADASGTSSRLTTIQKELDDLNSARPGATTDLAAQMDKRIRNLREEASILVRREQLLRRQAELENFLAGDGGTWNERRKARNELGRVQNDLIQNEMVGENARRHAAGQKSRNANYRMQELSYGVQDFAQVLSGGGGLDAALRAANNNISQFYAAAGGANAARNSMVATAAILGIATAMKYLADQTDLPIKRLEEFNDRLKKLQGTNAEIARIMESGATRLGDVSGEPGIGVGKAMADMGMGIRDKQDLLGNEVDIFGGRQKVGVGERIGGSAKLIMAENLQAFGNMAGLFSGSAGDYFKSGAEELRNTVAGSVLGQAFSDRFVDSKAASEVSLPAVMTAQQKKYFAAILGSKDTSTESAIKAFKEIDEGGGWRDVPKEEIEPFRESIRQLDEQLKKLAAAGKAFEASLASMGNNLKQRNALLVNAGSQKRLAAASEDVRFINEQNALASQQEQDAKALREEGLVKQAERAEKDAAARRRVVAVRMANMAPGGGAMLTSQAAAFEDTLSPFAEARAAAQKMLAEAQNPTGRAGALTQLRNIGLNEADTLRRESMGFSFSGQQANESFAEADKRLSETYNQMAKSIADRAKENGDAADAAKAKLNEAKQREEERRKSDRQFETESRYAVAFGTSFDKQKAALEKSSRDEERKIRQDYSDNPEELERQLDLSSWAHGREGREIEKMAGRAKWGAMNMFSSQAASLMGGRDAQHFSNAKQLEDNLHAIEDAVDAGLFEGREGDIEEKRKQAQAVYEEQKKQIEQKQVGFSDIGGMWKQIQMSLKPDKSIEMQKIANDHLGKIKDMAEGAGLKVQISLGA